MKKLILFLLLLTSENALAFDYERMNHLLYQVFEKERMCNKDHKISKELRKIMIHKGYNYDPDRISIGYKLGTVIGIRLHWDEVCKEFK